MIEAARVDQGLAYAADGDVYFDVARYPDYGKLSQARTSRSWSPARGSRSSERKRDPRRLRALEGGQARRAVAGDSPWGPGRPGWHIECSAMAMKYLGRDASTSTAAGWTSSSRTTRTRSPSPRPPRASRSPAFWMHNGFVNLGPTKMSKSLGNIADDRDAADAARPGGRCGSFLLQTHYRNPDRVHRRGGRGDAAPPRAVPGAGRRSPTTGRRGGGPRAHRARPGRAFLATVAALRERFEAAMDDDFNTPKPSGP